MGWVGSQVDADTYRIQMPNSCIFQQACWGGNLGTNLRVCSGLCSGVLRLQKSFMVELNLSRSAVAISTQDSSFLFL